MPPARPDDVAVRRTALEILYQKGDREAIKAAVAHLPAGADDDAELWKFRGLACEWRGDMPGEAEAFRRAVSLDPAEGEYLYKLGVAEQRAGQPEQAAQHLRRSQELRQAFPKFHDAYFDFLDILQKSHPGNSDYNAAVERLAGFCDLYGWKPEAQASRQLIAPNDRPARPGPADAAAGPGGRFASVQGRWKTSSASVQILPFAAASGRGSWHGSVCRHRRWVSGSAAIAFMSASKLSPVYSR